MVRYSGKIKKDTDDLDYYTIAKKDANKKSKYYHFTTLEALEKIVSSNSFRFSSLSIVKDPFEHNRLDNLWKKKVFVFCLTEEMSEDMWKQYGDNANGVCLEVSKDTLCNIKIIDENNNEVSEFDGKTDQAHKTSKNISDWVQFDVSLLKVIYDDELANKYTIDEDLLEFFTGVEGVSKKDLMKRSALGYCKTCDFGFEKETRIRLTLRPKGNEYRNGSYVIPNFDYVYGKIPLQRQIRIHLHKSSPLLEENIVKILNNYDCHNFILKKVNR